MFLTSLSALRQSARRSGPALARPVCRLFASDSGNEASKQPLSYPKTIFLLDSLNVVNSALILLTCYAFTCRN